VLFNVVVPGEQLKCGQFELQCALRGKNTLDCEESVSKNVNDLI
jgi:hypothetical protein